MIGFAAQSLKRCPFCNCEMQMTTIGRDWIRIKPLTEHKESCILFGIEHDFPYDETGKTAAANTWNDRNENKATKHALSNVYKEITDETRMTKKAKSLAVAIVLNELSDIENNSS